MSFVFPFADVIDAPFAGQRLAPFANCFYRQSYVQQGPNKVTFNRGQAPGYSNKGQYCDEFLIM